MRPNDFATFYRSPKRSDKSTKVYHCSRIQAKRRCRRHRCSASELSRPAKAGRDAHSIVNQRFFALKATAATWPS